MKPKSPEQVFVTGLCALDRAQVMEGLQHWGSFTGAGFRMEFQPLHIDDPERVAYLRTMPPSFREAARPPEIRIIARSQERAGIAALLLYAADAVISGCVPQGLFVGWDPYEARAIKPKQEANCKPAQTAVDDGPRIQKDSMVDVAGLAARLSRRRRLTDAAFSYLASVYLYSLEPMNLHPSWGTRTIPRISNPMHRVWDAQSLMAAFQVIEILKLNVKRPDRDTPSIIKKVWNPAIRANLEDRLKAIGIRPEARFVWTSRGTATIAQRKMDARTSESRPSRWSEGLVRDVEIPYVDAINHAGQLRSSIAAHLSSSKLRGLHPLDTHNVQALARMLLMHAAKFPWWQDRKVKQDLIEPS